jgi:uncharacterized membrane protein (UPF0127 family)
VTLILCVAAAGLVLGGCSEPAIPDTDGAPSTAPPTPLPVTERPRAVLPDGQEIVLELAVTPEETAQGLMFRPSMAADRGMLFIFPELDFPSFWMKNTWIALDIVFLDPSGTVVDIAHDAQPCHSEPCPRYASRERALAVLELVAGTAAQHGVEPGVQLEFANISGYPRQ